MAIDNLSRAAWPVLSAVLLSTVVAMPAAAAEPTTHFFTSFEEGDPQPDWVDTVETDAEGNERMSGVTGSPVMLIPGNVTHRVQEVRARGENPPNETADKVVDRDFNTKWLDFNPTSWVAVRLDEPVVVVHYALTSANDAPSRDPRDWTLEGSDDGETWTTLNTQTDQEFPARFHTNDYRFDNDTAYLWYRLDITRNWGSDIIQLAELQLSNGDTTPPPPTPMKSFVSGGPVNGFTMQPNAGWTGHNALQYSGEHTADGRGFSYNKVFDVDIDVTAATELSYVIFPEFTADDMSYPSTFAAVDLAFTDGTYLSELDALDHHSFGLDPTSQGTSDSLWPDQWNHKRSRVGDVAAGNTIDRILIGYDAPSGPARFNGWLDDIRVGDARPLVAERPSDHVVTTRGTNSSGGFSRGNTIPATAVPHGFNFYVPMTDAGSTTWLYEYQRANNADNLPAVEAFAISHETSPWMGDRQTFQVMPSRQLPTTDRGARELAFRHENEIAKPHHYGVEFENGVRTDIAPADHSAMFEFTFTGDVSYVMFDNVNNNGGLTLDPVAGTVTGYSDVRSGLSNGATRLFVYAIFDRTPTAGLEPPSARPNVFGYFQFDTSADKNVTMRIATSLISVEQAKRNLALEIAPTDTFEDVRARAQQAWDDKLSVVVVEGATEDQLITLYSNLYRLFLYPNSAYENVGTADDPIYRHAVQSSTTTPPSAPTETGAPVVDGKVYVNNGFWDTYRTTWSAYSLLTPMQGGEMVDGFVQQYRDGGWVSRWSSPGYANLMTGTSSDVAFADAYVKGVPGIDPIDTYDAALRNATVAPPGPNPNNTSVGRKGLQTSIFRGYTASAVSEGVSWALEGYINDFGIANQARALADDPAVSAADRERFLEEYEYFLERARNYVHMFDPRIGFFQGRDADGDWKSAPEDYDPRVWGHDHDYTETNGWGFAFHVPHDGQGLANLYGGREALADKLDEFFATPETAQFPGSYGGTIHEMREARDVRMGQWGFSNQVSHHIPWMYLYAGEPAMTQAIVREALARLYVGSEIGQGYAGDEDNGETSAWYVFAALGLYPLQVGSENLVIGSPLFTKATVHLQNGADLVVNAPNNSPDNVYVQSLTINGQPYSKTYVPHSLLANGAVLDFEMGPEPSSWGTGADDLPPSITDDADVPRPMQDATGPDRGAATASEGADATALFDNTSATEAALDGDGPWVEYAFRDGSKQRVDFYTLTSNEDDATADPSSWVVEGSDDGTTWTVLDERHDETFPWRSQTRPFKLDRPSNFSRYRISFDDEGARLAEVEFLTSNEPLATPLSVDVAQTFAYAGETGEVEVTVTNDGEQPVRGGELTAAVPEGWSVEPETVTFGRLSSGESTTVILTVVVPENAAPGTYPIQVSATSDRGPGSGSGSVTVIGDAIEFCTFTSDEEPWLYQVGGAQSAANNDCNVGARFTDGNSFVTYRLPLRDGVAGSTLSIDMAQQFLVRISTDGENWVTALREERNIRDLSNRQEYEVDLSLLGDQDSEFLFVWIGDSQPADGWGAWISDVGLTMEGST